MKAILSLVVFSILLVGTIDIASAQSASHPLEIQWGESGNRDGEFYNPQNIAIDSDGNVYVTDLGNRRVQQFDNNGVFLKSWGSSGSGAGQFNSISGIAVDENSVYVVDNQLNKIQKFDLNGTFVTQWGTQGTSPGQFMYPNGITIGTNSTILVVDSGNNRIQQFTSDGEFMMTFGSSGSALDQFISPMGITTDADGNIYVSDPSSNRIKKFNSTGNFIEAFGPNSAGIPLRPHGMQIDPKGNLYVADGDNNRILRLDPTGMTLTSFGTMGTNPGQFKIAKDVALDKSGYLFVVDSNGHRIQKFGTPLVVEVEQTTESTTTTTETQTENTVNPVPNDFTKPTILPPNDLLIEATGGLTPVSVGQAMATDESGIQSLTSNAPEEFPIGITTVIWTAIDGAGNVAIATQTVTVSDTTPPTISPPSDIRVEASNPTQNIVELTAPIATDNVGVISITNDAPTSFPIGETIVTWTATDVMGNTSTVPQKVTIIDTSKPTLHVPADVTFEATSLDQNEVYLGEATVIDNGEILSITNDAPPFFGMGNTTVTWLVSDNSGNTVSDKQLVTVVDTTPPIIIPPENITFEALSTNSNHVNIGTINATDVQQVTITNDGLAAYPIGDTIVNWTATDASGNSATVQQIVSVVDTTAPFVNITKNIIREAINAEENTVDLGEVVVEDISEISSITNDAPDTFPFGNTTVTWTVTDSYDNEAIVEQIVSIVDTTPPKITGLKDITIEATDPDENFADLGQPKVTDKVEIASIVNDAPNSFPIGMTTVTWTASDTSGNSINATQIISVVDSTSPEIIPPQNITAEAEGPNGTSVQIGNATVSDAVGVLTLTNNAPQIFQLGNTTVTWTVIDLHGNENSANQTISVVDTIAPTITAPANVTFEAVDPSENQVTIGVANATDVVGIESVSNDAPPTFPLGDTLVTWIAIDTSGNSANATQTVSVVDTTPPEIIPGEKINVEATSETQNKIELNPPTTEDAVGVVSLENDTPSFFSVGDTIVTWNATDAAGNSAVLEQIVSVVDTTAPKLTPPPTKTVEATGAQGNVVEYGTATYSDAVGVTSITNDAPETFPLGLTSITWNATDAAGNTATKIQQISIIDTTPPTITPPSDIIVEAQSINNNTVTLIQATATDAVGLDTITNDAPSLFSLGDTLVTWIATDTSGNSANATQTVSVVDTTPPTIEPVTDVTLEATSARNNTVSLNPPKANDRISEVSVTSDAPSVFELGDTMVTWTATDEAGNSATATQKIIIVDTTAPELIVPDNVVIDATGIETVVPIGNATSEDLADPSPSISNDAPETFPLGQTIITWTAIDSLGNSASATQTVDVQACGKPISYYNMIEGTPGEDIITGTTLPDLIFGYGGDDIISGDKGNDCIFGGEGDDIIFGDQGNDGLNGNEGNDIIKGQSGSDTITAGTGMDVIDGGDDNDSCISNQDSDLVIKCES
ncbi:MAG TPA: HYR domain-containing protein [Nitrosopumilaceae archaeon]|nr:HYR domain-containing protein [Nitrosopumilaceae archaeon]